MKGGAWGEAVCNTVWESQSPSSIPHGLNHTRTAKDLTGTLTYRFEFTYDERFKDDAFGRT